MKIKTLILAMLVAGIAASIAVASPPQDKGRGGDHGKTTSAAKSQKGASASAAAKQRKADRRPVVMLVLKGEFVSVGSDSFAMLVKHSNKHARALRGKQVTVKVDAKTKFLRGGRAKLADLVPKDRLHVLVRAKKGEAAGSFELLAKLVHARPAQPTEDEAGTTTTTTTNSTTTTTTETSASSD